MQIDLHEEAAQMLEEFIRLAPNDLEGHFQLGAAYEIQAERSLNDSLTRHAVEELKLALSIQPRHAMAHYYLSKAYRRLEQYDWRTPSSRCMNASRREQRLVKRPGCYGFTKWENK